jgi:hypothetical protein
MKKKQKIENSREKRDLNPRDFLFYRIVIPFSVCFLLKKTQEFQNFVGILENLSFLNFKEN